MGRTRVDVEGCGRGCEEANGVDVCALDPGSFNRLVDLVLHSHHISSCHIISCFHKPPHSNRMTPSTSQQPHHTDRITPSPLSPTSAYKCASAATPSHPVREQHHHAPCGTNCETTTTLQQPHHSTCLASHRNQHPLPPAPAHHTPSSPPLAPGSPARQPKTASTVKTLRIANTRFLKWQPAILRVRCWGRGAPARRARAGRLSGTRGSPGPPRLPAGTPSPTCTILHVSHTVHNTAC